MQARALELIRALPDHRLIDRLVRGRSWIPLLGVMLAGIVAMQVELLKLNASIGRSIALSSGLQSRNDLLRSSISSLSDTQRIERLATRLGMVMPGPTSILFLDAGHTSAGRAAASIRAPDSTAFDSSLAASVAAAQAQSNGTVNSATSTVAAGPAASATSAGPPPSTSPATTAAPSTLGAASSPSAQSAPSAAVGTPQATARATTPSGSTGTQSPGAVRSTTPALSTGPTTAAPASPVGAASSGGHSPTGSP